MIVKVKYLLFFVLLLLLSFGIKSQNLEVFIRENPNDTYKLYIKHKAKDSLNVYSKLNDEYLKFISKSYILAGYDSIIYDTVKTAAYLTTGNKFEYDNIKLNYPDSLDFNLSGIKKISKFKHVDLQNLQSILNSILKEIVNEGYPFCELSIDSVGVEGNTINLDINIKQGQYYIFDSIYIKSNFKIRQHYIETYLGIKKGDKFSINKIEGIDKKLKNLKYVEQSNPYQLAFGKSNTELLLYLKKKKANNFNGMIGILPNNKTTGKLLLTGDINLLLLNSLGAGELFSFKWQKFEALSQKLNSEFSIPYIFKTKFGVGASFDIAKKDSSYLNTDFTGKIIFGNNTSNGFEMFFNRTSSFLISNDTLSDNFSDYKTNLFGILYRYSNTDNIFAPRKGMRLLVSSSLGTKIVDNESADSLKNLLQNKTSLDYSYYIPLFNYMTLKFRSLTSMIYSDKIFDNELQLIGGLNTIRGFDELSIPVSSYSILSTEIRYIFEQTSALFLFYDISYFERRFTKNDSFNYAMGVGAGIDLKTNAGIFSLIFAVGKQNENAFRFNASKIHIGYTGSF